MKHQSNISHQIFKYLDNQLSDADRVAFENQIAQDEFLRDAVEGFYGLNKKETQERLNKIRNKYQSKPVKRRKIVPFYLAAAASLLLLAAVVFFLQDKSESSTMAHDISEVTKPKDYSSPSVTKTTNPEANTSGAVTSKIEKEELSETSKLNALPKSSSNNEIVASSSTPQKQKIIISDPQSNHEQEALTVVPPPAKKKSIRIEEGINKLKSAAKNSYDYSSDDSYAEAKPLQIKKSVSLFDASTQSELSNLTVTALPSGTTLNVTKSGEFEIPDDQLIEHIVVQGEMHETALFSINSNNDKNRFPVKLKEPIAAYLDQSRMGNMMTTDANVDICQPINPELWTQTLNTKQSTTAAINAGVKGSVTLSFNVNKRGKPKNITVTKSLGYGLDQEAIRLLLSNARWTPKKDGGTCEVEVEF